MQRPKIIRERPKAKKQQALRNAPVRIRHTPVYLPNGKPTSLDMRKGMDTNALETNTHRSTIWIHYAKDVFSHQASDSLTGKQKARKCLVKTKEAGKIGSSAIQSLRSTIPHDKELYDWNADLAVKIDAPRPVQSTTRKVKPKTDWDASDVAADMAKRIVDSFGSEPCLSVRELIQDV